jgi:MFS family permease
MAVLDAFVVIIAAPSIQRQLHATDAGVQLVITGYVVTYAAGLVVGGRLGDIYGRRRVLGIGLVLFAATSLAAAAAPDQEVLVVARCLQGGAAALMYPQALASVRVLFGDGRALGRAMAIWGVTLGLASAAAQLIGALVIDANLAGLGWRSVFAVNVPLGLLLAALAPLAVPESRADRRPHLDLSGVLMLATVLVAIVLPMTAGRELGWPVWAWPAMGGAVLLAGLFVAHERRVARAGLVPLIALDLLLARGVRSGLAATLALYGGQLSLWTALTLYLQNGLGLSPLEAGLTTTPVGAGFLLASTLGSRLGRPRLLSATAIGLAAATAGLAWLVVSEVPRPAPAGLLALLGLTGAGFGVLIPALATAMLRATPAGHEGVAAGVMVTTQQAAGAVGVALSGVVLFGLLPHVAFGDAFAVALGLNVSLFLLAALLMRRLPA